MTDTHRFFATTPRGIETLLADELRALGAERVSAGRSGVNFVAALPTALRVCLWSRFANRVLLSLGEFEAADQEALYAGIQQFDWRDHVSPDGTLAVDFTASRDAAIAHTRFGAQKVKDAVVDQFRERTGRRPSVDPARPDLRINLHLVKKRARLAVDLAGESLHRRGYREQGAMAPLKENLAAAILAFAGWPEAAREGLPLIDPMCGSGTLPIEAAMMAGDVAPGLQRTYFGFQRWLGHDPAAWQELVDEALERREAGLSRIPPLYGFDADPRALSAARANLERADLTGYVHFERREVAESTPPGKRPGLLVVNPPYGERLGDLESVAVLYRELGGILRARFGGWRAALFTGNPDLARGVGLKADQQWTLFNGPIECRLFDYRVNETRAAATHYVEARHRQRDLRPATDTGSPGAQMFANRLRKNRKRLARWVQREGIDCWRLYDADLPEYAVAVDLYQGERLWANVQEYEAPPTIDPELADARLREALAVIAEVLEIPQGDVFLKVRRREKGGGQYGKLAAERNFHEVREGRARLLVNFTDYLDTGLFLDHRITRFMIGDLATGQDFLNLFAYTGAATVHAAVGGANSTTSVDLSQTYLDWAGRNLALNGYTGASHRLVRADCREWLAEQARGPGRGRYGLIFLDPPTFSNSKRMEGVFDVQRDHVELIRNAHALLAPGGILLFSNNNRRFRLDEKSLARLEPEEITASTIPRDFERNPRIHRAWIIHRR